MSDTNLDISVELMSGYMNKSLSADNGIEFPREVSMSVVAGSRGVFFPGPERFLILGVVDLAPLFEALLLEVFLDLWAGPEMLNDETHDTIQKKNIYKNYTGKPD